MKNNSFYLFMLLLFPVCSFAQDVGGKTLVSQSRTTTVNIGKCDITIKYHSPSVNGRKIFGGIVPFDFEVDGKEYPWRAGSNQRTTIEFSRDVEIEGKALPAGSYGFLVLVSEGEWTLIFSSGTSWGAFNYDKANDVLRIPVKTQKRSFQEWLSYEFNDPKEESVDIQLRWEETAVTFNVKTNVLANVFSELESEEEKTSATYQELAIRTLERDPNDHEKAMEYLELSKDKIPEYEEERYQKVYTFNYKVLKGELLIDMGKKKEGKQLIDEALDAAEGFNMYYYSLNKLMVKGEQGEALRLLKGATKKDPDNFQNHFAFGEYYLKLEDQEKATEHFKKAYGLAVEQESRWINYARYLYLQNKLALERM